MFSIIYFIKETIQQHKYIVQDMISDIKSLNIIFLLLAYYFSNMSRMFCTSGVEKKTKMAMIKI